MAIDTVPPANGSSDVTPLSAKIVNITLAKDLKPKPKIEEMVFGEIKTDHMLIVTHEPGSGWSIPEIKPYGPLSIDPASSCLQYCPNVFEGMKAYHGPDGKVRLFRPELNMRRFARSAERVALPPFDTDALLELIKRLVDVEAAWIPNAPGYSLYIRPTMIGTRSSLGVAASDSATLYVILSPTGPYYPGDIEGIRLLAVGKTVRAWPGGTGDHKLGLNYSPTFLPQRIAAKQGYTQILWLLGEESRITEAGAMNFFVVVKRDDGDLDVITPPLDGTILPGVTRASCLALLEAHTSQKFELPSIPPTQRLHTYERTVTMHDLNSWSTEGKLLEAFVVGTAIIVAPVRCIGFEGKDLVFPPDMGPVGQALRERIVDIQIGKVQWNNWSVVVGETHKN